MNKLSISIAVAIALGLSACGDSLDDIKKDTEEQGYVKPLSRIAFDPAATPPVLSVPNDLGFQGTQDGTLTLDSGDNPDYSNPQVALGALDGWSTQNPFTIAVNLIAGRTLVTDSVSVPGTVRLFEVLMGDPASTESQCTSMTRGHACQVVSELTFGVDFYTSVSGSDIVVIPLKPLKAASNYLLAISNGLKDSENEAVAPSSSYELLKQDFATKPLSTEAQRTLQQVINSFENALAQEGVNKDHIIYTAAITTQSVDTVLTTLKSLMASPTPTGYQPSALVVQDTGLTVSQVNPAFQSNPLFALARLYQGSVTLPYYSGMPTVDAPGLPLSARWTARCDSGAIINALTPEQKPEAPQSENDAFCQAASSGALRDFGLDTARHLTKFNTIPRISALVPVTVQMTVPDETMVTKPANGWPVVILQHGITSRKTDMLALTGALSAQGFATVAIDHPLHGDRGFNTINASNGDATVYMNLQSLLTTRDNLRQSIADMLALRLSLNNVQGADLDVSNVQFVGHSLGAISGTSMVALANAPTGSAALDAAYKIQSAVLAMPGGAIANFLLESPRFSPLIKASLILGAGGDIATSYTTFAQNDSCAVGAGVPFAACYAPFIEYLSSNGQDAVISQLNATFSRFAFAAQTVVDSGDPNNYAAVLAASATPTYIIEVAGDGATNLPDQVIPNGYRHFSQALQAGKMPLAGTEPLATLLDASSVVATAGQQMVEGVSISRFNAGDHSSILSPVASAAVTTEMQTQIASFLKAQGNAVVVANPSVLTAN